MQTRQITEYKIYFLSLADVRGGVDRAQPVVAFEELEDLVNWYEAQKESWEDDPSADFYGNVHTYNKAFKEGSFLEWYNPVYENLNPSENPSSFGGVGFTWLKDTNNLSVPLNPKL